jgi:hypothetical protein
MSYVTYSAVVRLAEASPRVIYFALSF